MSAGPSASACTRPFDLITDYEHDFQGRYYDERSEVRV